MKLQKKPIRSNYMTATRFARKGMRYSRTRVARSRSVKLGRGHDFVTRLVFTRL